MINFMNLFWILNLIYIFAHYKNEINMNKYTTISLGVISLVVVLVIKWLW